METPLIRFVCGLLFSMRLVGGCGPTVAPEITTLPTDPVAEKALEELLKNWEKQSAEVQSLRAEFSRVDTSELFGRQTRYDGEYVAKGSDLAMMRLKEKGNIQGVQIFQSANRILRFQAANRQVLVFPNADKAAKKGKLLDLSFMIFAHPRLDDPFFFKIRAEDLRAKYRVDLLPESNGRHHLRLVPKTAGGRSEFSSIQLLLDQGTLQPFAVKMWSPAGKDSRLFTFTSLAINPAIEDETFNPKVPEGWAVIDPWDAMPPG